MKSPKSPRLIVLSLLAIALAWTSPIMGIVHDPAPHFENLLSNPNGDEGSLGGWTVTSNGGNGWFAYAGPYEDEAADNGFLTSFEWARREQVVDLLASGFSADYLDAQPPIIVSEVFEKVFCADNFYVEIELLSANMQVLHSWSSGYLRHANTTCDYSGYKEQVRTELANYGSGVRYVRWRDGGKDSEYWWGHFGPKLQNAYLAFAPANLLNNPGELASWSVSDPLAFEVTGPANMRQFRTSYFWGVRQQTVDLLALGFSAHDLDSGRLPILAKGTYREVACPDEYYLKVELLDQNFAVLATQDSGVMTHEGECDWTYSLHGEIIHHSFVSYPPGVRYIRWEDGGKDREFWAGRFGAILEAPYLAIVNYSPAWNAESGRMLSLSSLFDYALPDIAEATASYLSSEDDDVVRVLKSHPLDSQATSCDASCKLQKIKMDLGSGTHSRLWSVELNSQIKIFASPENPVDLNNLQAPGDSLRLAVGEAIKKGRRLIDITTLDRIEDKWIKTINAALISIDQAARGGNDQIEVRIFLGLSGADEAGYLGGMPSASWDDHLDSILRHVAQSLPADSPITIHIAGSRNGSYWANWNHSKIVAVDGKEAFTGGHNLWDVYLNEAPVFDTSIRVSGDSAMAAHRFVDDLWEAHLSLYPVYTGFNPNPNASSYGSSHILFWKKGKITRVINESQLGAAHFPPKASTILGNVSSSPSGSIEILSVAQNRSDSPLQKVVLNMINAATHSIYISQQGLTHILLGQPLIVTSSNSVDRTLVARLVRRAIDGVHVHVVLSNPGAPYATGPSADNTALLHLMWAAATEDGVKDDFLNRMKFCHNLTLSSLRVDDKPTRTYPNRAQSFANHSKTIMIDKQVFLIGSHNLYSQTPAQLSEFAYVVADQAEAEKFFLSYWNPVLENSLDGAILPIICQSELSGFTGPRVRTED